jgi:hypothetical protein
MKKRKPLSVLSLLLSRYMIALGINIPVPLTLILDFSAELRSIALREVRRGKRKLRDMIVPSLTN